MVDQRWMTMGWIALVALGAVACSDDDEPSNLVGLDATPYAFEEAGPWYECPDEVFEEQGFGADVVEVEALSSVHQYFGDDDRRTVEEVVEFPEGEWAQIGLVWELDCPEGEVCDHWDRAGSLAIAGEDGEKAVEVLRHITPYRMGMCQFVEVTELADVLEGEQRVRSFVDTWVGPGHQEGAGWEVSARFVFFPGVDDRPREVINIWDEHRITVGELEEGEDVASQVEPVAFELEEGFERVEAHLTTTGHSFGNSLNCAEFCEMRHDLEVNGQVHSTLPWRSDCADNPVSPQAGTWQHNRNGWCPGAVSLGDRLDITEDVAAGENELDFDIRLANGEVYDNQSPADLLPFTRVALKLYVY